MRAVGPRWRRAASPPSGGGFPRGRRIWDRRRPREHGAVGTAKENKLEAAPARFGTAVPAGAERGRRGAEPGGEVRSLPRPTPPLREAPGHRF